MSAKQRCKNCSHPGGTNRRVGNMSKADAHKQNPKRAHDEQQAKSSCSCECHKMRIWINNMI